MPRHARNLLATTVIALVIAAFAAAPAAATLPGSNGRITFMRFEADHWQVWVSKPDLSDAIQITDGTFESVCPVWSPDGRRIAFDSNRSDPDPTDDIGINDVFTMRPDGTGMTKVTDSHGFSGEPAWSPDGSLIAFSSDRGVYPQRQAIYVIRPDGSGMRRVTEKPRGGAWQSSPRFSPDGRKLVFTETRPAPPPPPDGEGEVGEETSALFTINLDGSRLRRITPWATHPGDADWSPDGKRIVFETIFEWPGRAANVWVVDADGGHLKQLTFDEVQLADPDQPFLFEGSYDPVWSPDGRSILFSHDEYGPEDGSSGLQTMRPDGSGPAWVSTVHGAEHQADWASIRPRR